MNTVLAWLTHNIITKLEHNWNNRSDFIVFTHIHPYITCIYSHKNKKNRQTDFADIKLKKKISTYTHAKTHIGCFTKYRKKNKKNIEYLLNEKDLHFKFWGSTRDIRETGWWGSHNIRQMRWQQREVCTRNSQ